MIKQIDFPNYNLTYSPMNCDSFLAFRYNSSTEYLTCSSSFIKEKCCNACKSKIHFRTHLIEIGTN